MPRQEVTIYQDENIQNKTQALADSLGDKDKCVMVHVIITSSNEDANETIHYHAVTGETKGSHLKLFISAMERKITWLRDVLYILT